MERLFTIALTLIILAIIPRLASAQYYADENDNPGFFISATTTSTILVVGVGTLTIATIRRDPKKIEAFLWQNRSALRASLSLGSGIILNDFAKLLGIPEKEFARFRKSIKSRRNFILPFTQPSKHKDIGVLITWINRDFPFTARSI